MACLTFANLARHRARSSKLWVVAPLTLRRFMREAYHNGF